MNNNNNTTSTLQNANESFHDVIPYPDRLVLFRSDITEHQVLPSLKRDRMAITIWFYGYEDFAIETKEDVDSVDKSTVIDGCRSNSEIDLTSVQSNMTFKHYHDQEHPEDNNVKHPPTESDSIPAPLPILPIQIPPLSSTQPINPTQQQEEHTIFVSIPSYRDSETFPTIHSLLTMAQYPHRIRIGLVLKYDTQCNDEVRVRRNVETKRTVAKG